MQRYLLISATVAALMLLGAGCGKPATPTPTPAATNQNAPVGATSARPATDTLTVLILKDGSFEPTTAFIKVGTTVTWINDTDKPHRVDSNPHPKHTDYPEFGTRKPLAPGESYTYTFTKAMRLNYHDHLNPAFGGAVDVTE